MLVLNRRGPITNLIGSGIGFVAEFNADRKERKENEKNEFNNNENEDVDHEWALAIDEAQQESEKPRTPTNEDKNIEEMIDEFTQRYPPPPYQQQPHGGLSMPVVLPQRRPQSHTRGFVRGYAPVLEEANVSQAAWFEFLDGFEKSINKNGLFWAANFAVWCADKAYIVCCEAHFTHAR